MYARNKIFESELVEKDIVSIVNSTTTLGEVYQRARKLVKVLALINFYSEDEENFLFHVIVQLVEKKREQLGL